MKITIETNGYRMVISEDDLESFGFSIPCDVHHLPDGTKELGRTHISLTGLFKEDVRPMWEEVPDGDQ